MKMTKTKSITILITGAVIFILGITLQIISAETRYIGFTLGFGSSWIVLGIIQLVRIKKHPELVRQGEIQENDERFIQIRGKSGYMAFLISIITNFAVAIIFLIMNNFTACVITVSTMLIQCICFFVAAYIYDKRM